MIVIYFFESRCISDPILSDIGFKNKMILVGTTLNVLFICFENVGNGVDERMVETCS